MIWMVTKWETLTEEDLPDYYMRDLPYEVTATVHGTNSFVLKLLPILDPRCNPISYPEDRRVMDMGKPNELYYVLKDNLLKYFIKC